MIYTVKRAYTDRRVEAMYGILHSEGSEDIMTCERIWNDNVPGKSAIPPGQYHLVPHNGTKYKDTFAFVGRDVAHHQTEGVPRSECVLHWEDDGAFLQGCMSFGRHVEFNPKGSKLREDMTRSVVEEIKMIMESGEDVYFNIIESDS